MAVSITSEAPAHNLSRNQIIFSVNTDRYPSNLSAQNVNLINLTAGPAAGNQMLIQWVADGEVKQAHFYFVTPGTEDDSGEQVPAFTGGAIADYEENTFLPCLLGHPLLSQYFQVLYQSGQIALISIVDGEYNLNIVPNGSFNVTFVSFNAGENFETLTDYQLLYRALVRKEYENDDFLYTPWHTAIPDTTGALTIDAAPIIHHLNTLTDSITQTFTAQFYKHTHTIREIYVEVSERWINTTGNKATLEQKKVLRSTPKYAIRGAEPIKLWSTSHFNNRVGQWLGLQGTERRLTFTTAAAISVILPSSVDITQTLALEFSILKSDGTTVNGSTFNNTGFKYNDLITVPSGYMALGLDSAVAVEEAVCYTLKLTANSSLVTNEITIIPEKSKRLHRQFLYRGAQGTAEVLMLNGEQEETTEGTATNVETLRVAGIKPDQHSSRRINRGSNNTLTVNTGIMSSLYKDVFWEILHSPEHYIMENGAWCAVTITNKSAISKALNRRGDNLLSIPLTLAFNRDVS